jgi:hypothetical protein
MCSACLRNYKRRTSVRFYLGTTYSEISRRCKTYDALRPNYYKMKKCSKVDFINKFIKDKQFLLQFKLWQKNKFQRKFAPSVDRIDNKKGYTLDNIQFISQSFNSKKDCSNHLMVNDVFFYSQADAAKYIDISPPLLCRLLKNRSSIIYQGFTIERV